jgi:iron complex transport system ATP-binding protein
LIDVLGVGARREARWPTLSRGERGRALIARALMPPAASAPARRTAIGLDLAAPEQFIDRLDVLRAGHPAHATVLVIHHLEKLPASTTHAMLQRAGECFAAGPAETVPAQAGRTGPFAGTRPQTSDDRGRVRCVTGRRSG